MTRGLAGEDAGSRLEARRAGPLTASTSSSAARTARSASSSCATGVPQTAITASPMNFSTVPPCTLDDPGRLLEVAAEQLAHRLRVAVLGERREADEVGEEHGDQASLGFGPVRQSGLERRGVSVPARTVPQVDAEARVGAVRPRRSWGR